MNCTGVDAGLIQELGSDEGSEVLIKVDRAFTGQGIWQPVSNICSAVAGLDFGAVVEALTFGPRSRKSESRGTRKKERKDDDNCQTAIAFQNRRHR